MNAKKQGQTVGREEPDFKFDHWTILFLIIGFACSWINMMLIFSIQQGTFSPQIKINSYLSVIFTTIIPGVIISYKNRYCGYGYMIGFATAGIPYAILEDLFIGGYTFSVALMIFTILWLIFWKAWRSIGAIKSAN